MIYRSYKKNLRCFIIVAMLAAALSSASFATQTTKHLAIGVDFRQDINTDSTCALVTNVITVDTDNRNAKLKAALAGDFVCEEGLSKGREAVSALTGRKGALLGVNADYFPFTGDPLGVCIVDGELVSEPYGSRVAMAVSKNGMVTFDKPRQSASLTLTGGASRQIDGINRGRETNQVVLYTETFAASTQTKYKGTEIVLKSDDLPVRVGKDIKFTVVDVKADAINTPIPKGGAVLSAGGPAAWFLKQNLKPGDSLNIRFDIKSDICYDWTQVDQAVGGGPWLVKDGKESVDFADEGFSVSFACARHPRTAAGLTSDNKLLLVTVDGRQSISGGLSLNELASLMKRLGAVNAINLDGGGSTTLSIKGIVINSPSGGAQRQVADALLIFADQTPAAELAKLAISGIGSEIAVGEGAQLYLTWGDDSQMLTQEQLQRVVWGITNGIGFVNQQGYFTPTRSGRGTITAFYGSQRISLGVTVISKKPETPVNPDLIPAEPSAPASSAGSELAEPELGTN